MRRFTIHTSDTSGTRARTGSYRTAHGDVRTPVFFPVGTAASVKSVTTQDVTGLGFGTIMCNTYHLSLRPGVQTVEALGGLHGMMRHGGSIITDSGGYQVFSLAKMRSVDDAGVTFHSHLDGTEIRLTPQIVVETQHRFGSDITMPLDVCPPWGASEADVLAAVERTTAWYKASIGAVGPLREALGEQTPPALFALLQGGFTRQGRHDAWQRLADLPRDGIAVGGLSVGEPKEALREAMTFVPPLLPHEDVKYLMGVGEPTDLVEAVAQGFDMFDCVLPTREARNGRLYYANGYINLSASYWKRCLRPAATDAIAPEWERYSLGYLHHLHHAQELTYYRLATLHNLRFFSQLLEIIRNAIEAGRYGPWRDTFLGNWRGLLSAEAELAGFEALPYARFFNTVT